MTCSQHVTLFFKKSTFLFNKIILRSTIFSSFCYAVTHLASFRTHYSHRLASIKNLKLWFIFIGILFIVNVRFLIKLWIFDASEILTHAKLARVFEQMCWCLWWRKHLSLVLTHRYFQAQSHIRLNIFNLEMLFLFAHSSTGTSMLKECLHIESEDFKCHLFIDPSYKENNHLKRQRFLKCSWQPGHEWGNKGEFGIITWCRVDYIRHDECCSMLQPLKSFLHKNKHMNPAFHNQDEIGLWDQFGLFLTKV